MSSAEYSWAVVLQRSVFGWIVGGTVLLGTVISLSMLIMSVVGRDLNSQWVAFAALLYYGFFFGSLAAAHGFLLISFLGLLILPFRPIRYKTVTLTVSAFGLIAALQVLMPIYLNRSFLGGN